MGETISRINIIMQESGFGELAAKASKIVGVLAQIGITSKGASKGTDKAGKSAKEAGSKASLAAKGFKSFLKALMRVAVYRFIRSIIREMSEALKEGTENVYMYSKAMNGLDSTNVKGNLDSVATSVLYLKNALGAALTPVIQLLTPLITALADKVAYLGNMLSKWGGALLGNASYTAAKKFGTTYEKSLGNATKAAEKLKRTLLGFDEINRLDDNSSSSSDSGYSTEDYLGMFEDIELEDSYSKKIKNIFTIISEVVGASLVGLGAILLCVPGCGLTGIGLIAAGLALTLAPLTFNDDLRKNIEKNLGLIETIASGCALALGLILALAAPTPFLKGVGLALIGVGVIGFATTVRENWDTVPNNVKTALGVIGITIGVVAFLIGAVLAFSGAAIPVGLALMVGGVGAMFGGASALGVDWNALGKKLGEAIDRAKEITSKKLAELKEKFETWRANLKTPHFDWSTQELPKGTVRYKILQALNLPTSLPKLNVSWYARGGIVDGATLIGAGERGAEAIVPLENNTEWIDKIAERLISAQGEQNIVLNVDGKQLFDIIVNRNNSIVRTTSRSPLLI